MPQIGSIVEENVVMTRENSQEGSPSDPFGIPSIITGFRRLHPFKTEERGVSEELHSVLEIRRAHEITWHSTWQEVPITGFQVKVDTLKWSVR